MLSLSRDKAALNLKPEFRKPRECTAAQPSLVNLDLTTGQIGADIQGAEGHGNALSQESWRAVRRLEKRTSR